MTTMQPGFQRIPWSRRRPRWWPTSWRDFRSRVAAWWYSIGGAEIRAAVQDARRAPGWITLGLIAVFWPLSGLDIMPLLAGLGALVLLSIVNRFMPWWMRRRVRRLYRPAAGLVAFGWLVLTAGVWAWLAAVGLWLVFAGLTDTLRARRRLLSWVITGIAAATRQEPEQFRARHATWKGRVLQEVEIFYPAEVRPEEPSRRDLVLQTVRWRLKHAGAYDVDFPAGYTAIHIKAVSTLPTKVYDHLWPEQMREIPIGVTDDQSAGMFYEERSEDGSQTLERLPLAVSDPDEQRNIMVIGGTGAGKTNFVRGYIARGMRLGKFPGGVIILDGKGSSAYAPFVGRHGIIMIAREPEEWLEGLQAASAMMRSRYDRQWIYHTGGGVKPQLTRYLVVIEECQEIRAELGKDADRFYDQLGRQIRESEGTLMLVTQRPDAEGAIPGPVRDQLEDRVVLGFVSGTGARMALEDDYRMATDEYGEEMVRGRGVARLGGKLMRIQSFLLDAPLDNKEAEPFYPPPAGPEAPNVVRMPSTTNVWAPPRPAARQPAQQAPQGTQGRYVDPPTVPNVLPPNGPQEPLQPAAGDGQVVHRRRTI
ncbi:hypothetical protein D5S17_28920 [Pseudonocardiaceae bacterium YIM PH 21723]|nr:hypothetical protein D5S17_28920 [Pseudonocardiaceae bacterium YIM PH 21723]